MALLVSDRHITTELLVSPAEKNRRVSVYKEYDTEKPEAAVDPARALWDPGLSADFTSETGGNISYAHLIPVGERLEMWSNTYEASEAILSIRGPEISKVSRTEGQVKTWFSNPRSITLRTFSSNKSWWSGNIAYNDNHVDFHNNWYAHDKVTQTGEYFPRLKFPEGKEPDSFYHDVIFHDEEGFPSNHYLGIFTRAGETKEDYKAIWD